MHNTTTAMSGSHALPSQLTRFIGREREIVAVRQMLGTARILTLTGAGGSGKTRLALEVAGQVAEQYADGLVWVELAALTDPELIPHQVAAALGIREESGRSTGEALLEFVRDRALLVVLDNCEHLADACATLAETLLRNCPGLRILATSREALGVAGERAWLVPPLSLPDPAAETTPGSLAGSEAVQLFMERAQDALAAFSLTDRNAAAVVQICRRLDGIPLAIELAAARVRVLAPEQIADRLDNVFDLLTSGSRTGLPRHRTLRATIDWSYQLLSEPEQSLLQRLSIFTGGFTLEAVEAVCVDLTLEPWEVLDLVARLVDRSLVVVTERGGTARYHLLDTVGQYARERLRARGEEEALGRRHAEYFLAMATEAEPHVILARPKWMDRLDVELDNLRAAVAWSRDTYNDQAVGLPLTTALIWYWYHRLHWREGLRLLESALAGAADVPPAARAGALHGIGVFALYIGDLGLAERRLREAEGIWRATGNERWLSFTLSCLTTIALTNGNPDEAEVLAEECLRAARATGEPWDAALARGYPVMAVRMWRKDWTGADEHLADAERVFRDCGYAYGLSFVLDARAFIAVQRGELARAEELARLALGELAERRDEWLASRSLRVLGLTAARSNALERAVRLFAASDALLSSVAARGLRGEREDADEVLEQARAVLPERAFAQAWAEGSTMDLHRALAYAMAAADGPEARSSTGSPPQANGSMTPEQRVPPGDALRERGMARLHVRALGPLQIFLDGTPLPPDTWPYARPRELLLYLLSHPQGRTREQIGLAFWPDSSAAQVKNSFHVTLHHLRKVLGASEWVVLENERYRVNPELTSELDAATFEQQMAAALREARTGAGSTERVREVLALYRGDFLEDEGARDWHLEQRDHLRRLYIDGMLALGELLMQAAEYAAAAEIYQQIVIREDLQEDAHRRLILCLARTGERARALRHYERLVVLLREELDADPEKETTALYERLKQAEPV
jgi:predicted ATPase/DNA-binding SARP family transcriptional activator